MLRIAGISLIYLFLAAPLGHAQTLEEQYGMIVNDDAARDAIRLALKKIDTSMCEPQKRCAPATPEELTQPPITVLDARTAMAFGIKSALMRWCARGPKMVGDFDMVLDWARWQRKMSSRQIQLVDLIREDYHGRQSASLLGPCPDELRKELDPELTGIIFGPSTKF
jgi:hypothetical protein